MSLLLDIPPRDLGLPSRFAAYRPGQCDAIDWAIATLTDHPFAALCAPTGIGKSLIAATIALVLGLRAVYLTVTKGLQSQIMGDFSPIGMRDVRGRANYACRVYTRRPWPDRHLPGGQNCEEGADRGCQHAYGDDDCPYNAAVTAACASPLVSTNYAYWLWSRLANPAALGDVGLLICDEAHEVPEQLCSFLRVDFAHSDTPLSFPVVGSSGLMGTPASEFLTRWASDRLPEVTTRLQASKAANRADGQTSHGDRELESFARRLLSILSMGKDWVWEITDDGLTIEPIWPAPYASTLWSGVPKILFMSATLRPYALEMLGLSQDECPFEEFDNGWQPQLAPTYHVPTVKLRYTSTDEDFAKVVDAIDRIIDARQDRKGLIHAVSYERMRRILRLSRHANRMLVNDRSSTAPETVRFFRAAEPPCVLVSPSFSSGWDFPYRQCEFQILPKAPFPPATSRVMKERVNDPRYRSYCAMLDVVQMIGRGRRHPDDRCETFLLDNCFPWLLSQGRKHAPRGFRFRQTRDIPPAPPRAPETPTRN